MMARRVNIFILWVVINECGVQTSVWVRWGASKTLVKHEGEGEEGRHGEDERRTTTKVGAKKRVDRADGRAVVYKARMI